MLQNQYLNRLARRIQARLTIHTKTQAENNQTTSDSHETTIQNGSSETSQKIVPHKEGRFMDMIHSGGYKPAQSTSEKSDDRPSEPKKTLAPSQPSAWIDPIKSSLETDNMSSLSNHDDTVAPLSGIGDESTIEEQRGVNDTIDDTSSDETSVDKATPLPLASHESPFIEGSEKKVSKRPLGSGGTDDEGAKDNDGNDITSTEQSDETTSDEEQPQDIVLPPELEKELVELEETNELRQAPTPNELYDEDTPQEEITSRNEKNSKPPLTDTQSPSNISTSLSGLLESGETSETYQLKQDPDISPHETLHPLFADSHTETAATSPKNSHHSMTPLRWIVTVIGLIMLGMIIGASVFLLMTGGSGL